MPKRPIQNSLDYTKFYTVSYKFLIKLITILSRYTTRGFDNHIKINANIHYQLYNTICIYYNIHWSGHRLDSTVYSNVPYSNGLKKYWNDYVVGYPNSRGGCHNMGQ